MKVVCLIRPDPPLIYFANRIHAAHGVALVVVETGTRALHPAPKRSFRQRLGGLVSSLAAMIQGRKSRRASTDLTLFFGNQWRHLNPGVPVLTTSDINSDIVRQRLAVLAPDVIADHGTSIVSQQIASAAPVALNLHWGLSPYYRGVCCTEWALINRDPLNIGVTIHKLDRRIDGGDILAQRRARVEPTDSAHAINMKLTVLGTELMIAALDRLKSGRPLHFAVQDAHGDLRQIADWSPALAEEIRRIESDGLIAKMIDRPSRRTLLPIVEMTTYE